MALVATADDEFVDSGRSIQLHDVPENGAPADFDHRLGSDAAFFADARAVTAGENHCLHKPLPAGLRCRMRSVRSEEHTSELLSLMRISYAVFCLKKQKTLIPSI